MNRPTFAPAPASPSGSAREVPSEPLTRVAGIDWASTEHVVCVVGTTGTEIGQVIARFTITHTRAGLHKLLTRLRELQVVRVGIERPDGPVVQALLAAAGADGADGACPGLRVTVIPPRQVKNLRSRYPGSGKDDRGDAYVLADAIRTDGHRFADRVPDLTIDTPATSALKALTRGRKDLVETRVGLVNQLRHTLELAFPAAVGLFFDLHSPIARAFLREHPAAADAATGAGRDEHAMAAWLTAHGYCGRTTATELVRRLRDAAPGLTGPEALARRHVTLALLAAIDTIEARITDLTRQIKQALLLHPDAATFTSLPRAGTGVRAATLLAELGDARGRYPTWEALAAAAGASPVTFASGKHTGVGFRYNANTKLRAALMDFADDSRHASPWAADIYQRARARGHRHPHAVRVLARAWTQVIWTCWQNHTTYQPDRHGGLQRHLQEATATAA
jgi:transposase